MEPFNWLCPHCRHHVTITASKFGADIHNQVRDSADGLLGLISRWTVCPNEDCRKSTLNVAVHPYTYDRLNEKNYGEPILSLRLIPFGSSKPFPDYVPAPIREDYREACQIQDLSPKAAATLARRALQGILRDFYGVTPGKLVNEIKAVADKMEPELHAAIDAVREVGNIGAHMEKDINVIVDVDPDEAQLLIELVETAIEETYVRRDERRKRLAKVTAMAAAKQEARKALPKPPETSGG